MACGINDWPEASYVLACVSSSAVETAGYCESCPAGTLNAVLGTHMNACSTKQECGNPTGAKAQEMKTHLTARLKPVP
jgi:hypothetical protein